MILNVEDVFFQISDKYHFFTGVPDSLLKPFLSDLEKSKYKNIMATHESQAIGIAVGAEIAGVKACVYMQNSGLANCLDPLTSLCVPYDIYPLLIIGHRHTIPQHKIMGEIDESLLKMIGYPNYIIAKGN